MPLKIKRQVETRYTNVTIEPDQYPEDNFMAYIGFKDKEGAHEEYVLHIEPEDWERLKELVDETFSHMRTYVDSLPEEEE